jgi:N-acetylglutamate synthase-like GNAT family acetyltransferase
MIREATIADLPMIVDLLQEFHSGTEQPQGFVRGDVYDFMRGMIEGDSAIVLVSGKGLICGFVMPTVANKAWLVCLELYWYAKDGKGYKLMKAFTDRAKELGVNEVRFSHRSATPKIGKYLEKQGYSLDEQVYKRLL